ncbi:hypothetical protein ACLIKD_06875 [Azonexus sp. IMCC34842]|uniref:hypothetical protein n=1 Tax=Azonexus sp. IMCC34842 TaxID=3420950 RepID=UPI003D11C490
MKKITALLFFITIASGCANQQSTSTQSTSTTSTLGACATNFATEGSFFTGTRYSTFEEFPKKTVTGAFDALLQAVASSGYQIVSSNKEAGLISANQSVSYGQGKTAPMNFVIKKTTVPGVRVDVAFSMSGGVSASTESAQREFCKLLASVAQSPNESASVSSSNAPVATNKASDAPKSKKKKTSKTQ